MADDLPTPDDGVTADDVSDVSDDADAANDGPQVVSTRSSESLAKAKHFACLCARIADDYRGRDTVVLDLSGVTPIVDFFVISTGTTRRQMHAIAEEVDRVLGEEGSQRVGLEGYQESSWILQDYGDVVLHVFTEETRHLYDLERLWADAPRVDWQTAEPDESRPV